MLEHHLQPYEPYITISGTSRQSRARVGNPQVGVHDPFSNPVLDIRIYNGILSKSHREGFSRILLLKTLSREVYLPLRFSARLNGVNG